MSTVQSFGAAPMRRQMVSHSNAPRPQFGMNLGAVLAAGAAALAVAGGASASPTLSSLKADTLEKRQCGPACEPPPPTPETKQCKEAKKLRDVAKKASDAADQGKAKSQTEVNQKCTPSTQNSRDCKNAQNKFKLADSVAKAAQKAEDAAQKNVDKKCK